MSMLYVFMGKYGLSFCGTFAHLYCRPSVKVALFNNIAELFETFWLSLLNALAMLVLR